MTYDNRPGAINKFEGNLTMTPNTIREADAIDRIKQILASTHDMIQNQTEQVRSAANRIMGSSSPLTSAKPDYPVLSERTVYTILNDIEQAHRELNGELARFREQMP